LPNVYAASSAPRLLGAFGSGPCLGLFGKGVF